MSAGQRQRARSNHRRAPALLRALELAGGIVTLDAMGCQRRIAREINEADADYGLGRVHEFLAMRKAETRQTAAKKVLASLS